MRGLCWRHLDLIGYPVDLTRATERACASGIEVERQRIGEVSEASRGVDECSDKWINRKELCLANIPSCRQMTDLCGELVQWVGVYGVDS